MINEIDRLKDMADNHPDMEVRKAALACYLQTSTPQWRGRQMRRYLSNLSWALYAYIIKEAELKSAISKQRS